MRQLWATSGVGQGPLLGDVPGVLSGIPNRGEQEGVGEALCEDGGATGGAAVAEVSAGAGRYAFAPSSHTHGTSHQCLRD